MSIELLSPGWLLLALLVPLVWFLPHRLTDRGLGLLRTGVLLLLVLAAAQPVRYGLDERAWHVLVLDGSDSLAPERVEAHHESVRRFLAALPAGDRRALVTFGDAEAPIVRVAFPGIERRVHVSGRPGSSPLGAALASAARAIPDAARGSITLCTDGLATDSHWGRATSGLSARGIPVHVQAQPTRRPVASLLGLELPGLLRVGATAVPKALVRGGPGVRADVELRGPEGVLAIAHDVALDGIQSVPLAFEPKEAGFLPLTARIVVTSGEDPEPLDNVWRTTAAVQDPLRVLYLGGRMARGAARLAELVGRGLDLRDVPAGQRAQAGLLAGADLVLIDDCPADQIPAVLQQAIADAVRAGRTGLFMSGGRAAFGAGGYRQSPIAAVLPVRFIQKEEKRDPSTTLAVVIDTSGSMGGNRVQLAKEVARLAIRRLLPHDKVGIVEFYGAKRWAAPIQPASNAIEIQRALNRLNAGGGTVIMPAMEEAFYGLLNVRTRYKHVLVLTDGGVEQGAFEPLIRRMAQKGITVSTVLIGPDAHSEFLVSIANWGKGRFYSVPNRFNLPEILLKQPSSAHLPAWRPGRHRVDAEGGPGWWGDVEGSALPPLGGYVEAQARPGAQTLLRIRATKHPVLTTWRHGAGRATAFLTEPTGSGTAPWSKWPAYGSTLARVLARTASDTRTPFAFDLVREGSELRLTARRLLPLAALPLAALPIAREAGAGRTFVFRERAPGFFEARHSVDPAEEVRLRAGISGDLSTRLVSPAHADQRPERQADPRTALDLEALARATGGLTLDGADLASFVPPTGGGSAPVRVHLLWPWLLAAALLLYLVEIAWRRRSRSPVMEALV